MTTQTAVPAETPVQEATAVLSQDAMRLTHAWQDGLQALWDGYTEQWRRATELTLGLLTPPQPADGDGRPLLQRLGEASRAVGAAQGAFTQAWLSMPFWLAGTGSPVDLQAATVRLAEANRELLLAGLAATRAWQQTATAQSERVVTTVAQAADAQVQLVRRLANDTREVQQATLDATRSTASATREATNRVRQPGGVLSPGTAPSEQRRDR
jgi:hypothetical protein